MKNLKVQSTAWPEGGYYEYGKEGMEPVNPQNMSRVMLKAVQKQTKNRVRPGGVCYQDLKHELSQIKGIKI